MIKRITPWIGVLIALVWLVSNSLPPKTAPGDFDITAFGKIPVLVGGREKPLDTVARTSLMIIHGKQTLRLENGQTLEPMRWLADVLFTASAADRYPVFVINSPDVLGMFGWPQGERKYYSFAELTPFLKKIDEEGQKAENIESGQRSRFQTAIMNLRNSLVLYEGLKNSLQPEDTQGFAGEIETYVSALPAGLIETAHRQKGEKFDKDKFDALSGLKARDWNRVVLV